VAGRESDGQLLGYPTPYPGLASRKATACLINFVAGSVVEPLCPMGD